MTLSNLSKAAMCAWLFPVSMLLAADDTTPAPALHRPLVGFRVEYFPLRFFNITTIQTTTTVPAASYTYTAKSNSPKYIVGPTVEYRFTSHVSLGLELHFHHADYTQTTTLLSGVPPPNSTYDSRTTTTLTQESKINYWELPLLGHYYGLSSQGRLSRVYVTGGVDYRHVGRIRTGNTSAYPDGTSDYNETAPPANLTNQFGAVAGVGMRFLDDYNIKLAPEIRYVRWFGTTLEGPAFRSAGNQIEASIGLSF
jgi:outer membrane protein W